jgi:hypothetical protein
MWEQLRRSCTNDFDKAREHYDGSHISPTGECRARTLSTVRHHEDYNRHGHVCVDYAAMEKHPYTALFANIATLMGLLGGA